MKKLVTMVVASATLFSAAGQGLEVDVRPYMTIRTDTVYVQRVVKDTLIQQHTIVVQQNNNNNHKEEFDYRNTEEYKKTRRAIGGSVFAIFGLSFIISIIAKISVTNSY